MSNTNTNTNTDNFISQIVSEGTDDNVWGGFDVPNEDVAQEAARNVIAMLGERWRCEDRNAWLFGRPEGGLSVCCCSGVGIHHAEELWWDEVYRLSSCD